MGADDTPKIGIKQQDLGRKAIDLGLLTPMQLREVISKLSATPNADSDPRALAAALVSMGLLSQRQVDSLSEETAVRIKSLGKYRIIKKLGHGGMGVVFEAVDSELGRTVALKMIRSNAATDSEEAALDEERFIREARMSANVPKHPNIVGVYEAGMLEGKHYIAMEFIEGSHLSDWRQKESPSLRLQIGVLRDVAVAVDHAHRHNIIHRDLKPQNILIDSKGSPHVTDFGLAKQARQDASLSLSGAGRVTGTPTYMSPEQATGRRDVDHRADVWALGIMLFEMLTGRPPFKGETPVDIMMKAANEPVPAPSKVIREGTHVAFDQTLERICLKALARDRKDRYASARAFADDLGRWLKGQTVVIKPPPMVSKRPAWALGGTIFAGFTLIAVLVVFLASSSPSPEELATKKSQRVRDLVTQGKRHLNEGRYTDALVAFGEASNLDKTNTAAAAGKKEAEDKIARSRTPAAPAPAASTTAQEAIRKARDHARANPNDVEGQIQNWQIAKAAAAGTPFASEAEAGYAAAVGKRRASELQELDETIAGFREAELFWRARDALAKAAGRRAQPEWEAAVRSRQDDLQKHVAGIYEKIEQEAAAAKRSNDSAGVATLRGRVAQWKWADLVERLDESLSRITPPPPDAPPPTPVMAPSGMAELPALRAHENGIGSVAFSPQGNTVVTASFDKSIRLWDLSGRGLPKKLLDGTTVFSVAYSPDGRWVAAGVEDGTVMVWDTVKYQSRACSGHGGPVIAVAFSPDSKVLASASVDGTSRLWDPAAAALKGKFEGHPKGAVSVAFSPDGKLLAVGSAGSLIRIWDLASGKERRSFSEGIGGSTRAMAFSPDGKLLASGGQDSSLNVWDLGSNQVRRIAAQSKSIMGVAFSPDGRFVSAAWAEGILGIWDALSGEPRAIFKEPGGFFSLALSPKGDLLAGGTGSGRLRVWQLPAAGAPKAPSK